MRKEFLKIFGLVLIFGFALANICVASPLQLEHPSSGTTNIPVDDYFQWRVVAGAVKYILDIDRFTQSEDNIIPDAETCPGDGSCYFYFLDLTIGSIDYLTSYRWRITAYNAVGDPIDASPEWLFTTEQAPAPNGGNGNGNGGGNGGGPGGWIRVDLRNPLNANNLWDALDALVDFLFVLVIAIAPILIIYSASILLMARGNPAQINQARNIILWTLIAVALALLAEALPAVIRGALGG